MSEKSNLFDYESLPTRRQPKLAEEDSFKPSGFSTEARGMSEGFRSSSTAEAFDDDSVFKSKSSPASFTEDRQVSPVEDGETASIIPKKAAVEAWSLKRGHAVTFFGLFLFTCLVFFRPYEFSPSLLWLSKSAFWVAIFTITVFLITQLPLESRITARPREVIFVVLLLATCFISIPRALDPLRAWNSLTDYLKVVLIFIIMANVLRTKNRLLTLLILSLAAGCFLSYAAISDYWTGRLALQGLRIKGAIGGLFDNPNDLALHLVTAIPIAFALFFDSRNPLGKVFYVLSGLLMIAGLVATFSRGGFLGLACVLSVMLWRLMRKNKWLLGLILPIAAAVFLVASPAGYLTRLATTNDGSAIARTDDLKRSIVVTMHHPILGVGMNNYTSYSNNNLATHNAYTQVASELGIPGMIFYILFMITPLKHLRRIIKESTEHRRRSLFYLAVGLEASLVGYMVSSFFASVAYLWYVYYLVAYAICLRRLYLLQSEKIGELAEVS
jgi:O-antigen ligase